MKKAVNNVRQAAFTLVELIIVIAIITLLAGIVVVTINPANIFANSRNSQRANDLSSIQSAIQRYLADSPASGTAQRDLFRTGTWSGVTYTPAIGNGQTTTSFSTSTAGLAGVAGTGSAYSTAAGAAVGSCVAGSTATATTPFTSKGYKILTTGSGTDGAFNTASVDLTNLVSLGYLPKVPSDPVSGNYYMCIDTSSPTFSPGVNAAGTACANAQFTTTNTAYAGATCVTGTGIEQSCTNCLSNPGKLVVFTLSSEAVNGSTPLQYVVI